jgi:hypothetical protein
VAQRAVDAVLAEARAEIAAGRFPDVIALRAELAGDIEALARLDGVLAVHRARARVAKKVSDTKVSDTRRPLRTKPSVSADMDVRRAGEYVLEWDAQPGVATWELKVSERADARADYETVRELETGEGRVELELGDRPTRVSIVGRSPNGRLVRRAVVSGLSRESWNDRWNRR